jgi:hypothetical protein
MDFLTALILLLVLLFGFMAGRMSKRQPKALKSPKPICPCDHAISLHVDGIGKCMADLKRDRYNSIGDRIGYNYVPCPCQRYMGPELVTSLWSPGIALPPGNND